MFGAEMAGASPVLEDVERVLICDEHDLVRRSLTATLEETGAVEVVAEAADGAQAVTESIHTAPDLAFVSLVLPDRSGIETIRLINDVMPGIRIIALAVEETVDARLQAIRAGATGVLDKEKVLAEAELQLSHLLQRIPPIDREVAEAMTETFDQLIDGSGLASLTTAERDVLDALAEGVDPFTVDEAAGIARGEARNHLLNVIFRLHLGSPASAPEQPELVLAGMGL